MIVKPTFMTSLIHKAMIIYLGIFFSLISTEVLKASDLIDNSPFVPDDFNPDYSQLINVPENFKTGIARILEFRGFYSLAGEFYFNIYNNSEQKSDWVKIKESEAPYQVLKFEKNKNLIFIRFHGQTEELTLARPTHAPLSVSISHRDLIVPSIINNKTASRISKTNVANSTSLRRRRVITANE